MLAKAAATVVAKEESAEPEKAASPAQTDMPAEGVFDNGQRSNAGAFRRFGQIALKKARAKYGAKK